MKTDNVFDNTPDDSYLKDIAYGNRHSPKNDIVYFSRKVTAAQEVPEIGRHEAINNLAIELSGENLFLVEAIAEMLKKAKLISKSVFKAAVRENKQNKWSKSQKNKPPTDDEIVNRWLKLHPNTDYGLGGLKRYNNSNWANIAEKEIMNEIFDVLAYAKEEDHINPSFPLLKNITELAKVLRYIPDEQWDAESNLLPFQNGILRLDIRELIPHDPSYHLTTGLDYDFDPKATCPNFIKTLESTIPDQIDLIKEFAGYCLTTDTRHEIALVFYGPPGCGKSTLFLGLQNMLGPRAGELGLRELEKSHFALPKVIGKTLLMATEQPGGYLSNSDLINQLI